MFLRPSMVANLFHGPDGTVGSATEAGHNVACRIPILAQTVEPPFICP